MIKPGGSGIGRQDSTRKQDMMRKKEEEERQKALMAQEDTGIINQVDEMLNKAVKLNASDIHLEMVKEGPRIRARLQTEELQEISKPEHKNYPNLVNRLKVISNMDITISKSPQRGFFVREINGNNVEFETYSFPAVHGEKIVVKILYKRDIGYRVDQLGIEQAILGQYLKTLQKGHGLVLIVGPPGSGKNTTLYSSINYLNAPTKNVCTCESLIKYNLPGVIQGRHDERSDVSYEDLLRALAKQEPDLLLVGEIKTAETAKIVVQSAFAKRLVFGRLVANDTINGIQSFLDMGIQSFLVAASIHCVIAQRLVRKLCEKCREKYTPSHALLKEIALPLKENVQFYKNVGCNDCKNTGYKGLTGIFEFLHPNEELREMIVAREPAQAIRQAAIDHGMVTLKKDGIKKAFLGITTVEDVLNGL